MIIWHVTTTFSHPLVSHSGLSHLGFSSGSPSPYSSIRNFRTVPSELSSSRPGAMSLTALPPKLRRSRPSLRWTCSRMAAASLLSGWCFKSSSKSASHLSQIAYAKKAWALRYKAFWFRGSRDKILSVISLTLFHSPRFTKSCARLFLSTASSMWASSGKVPRAKSILTPDSHACCASSQSPRRNASLPVAFRVASTRPTQNAS
mmetsp:Transcript_51745/g.150358  ORF Transcript_51745/g.150358 Transcript_51745/m.150358 type:complete len:204 (-) Transcript_51745:224-835(-)